MKKIQERDLKIFKKKNPNRQNYQPDSYTKIKEQVKVKLPFLLSTQIKDQRGLKIRKPFEKKNKIKST
jgi:hypothetical protein